MPVMFAVQVNRNLYNLVKISLKSYHYAYQHYQCASKYYIEVKRFHI